MGSEDEIYYPKATMGQVARRARENWDSDISDNALAKINEPGANASLFGDIPDLAAYGRVFEQVKAVYVEALKGAKADLENVRTGIVESLANAEAQDEQAEAALVALWNRWNTSPQESERRREETEATPEVQEAAADTEAAQSATGAAPDSEQEPETATTPNADTRDEGAIPANPGPGPQTNPTP